jgi:hypothetical protein
MMAALLAMGDTPGWPKRAQSRGAVFASHAPVTKEQGNLLSAFDKPDLAARAEAVGATAHTVGDRVYILDGNLGGHSQTKKILEAVSQSLEQVHRADLSQAAGSPTVSSLARQAFGPRSMAVEGLEDARCVLIPAQRVWLSDGKDWVGVDLPPKLNSTTLESLKARPLKFAGKGSDLFGKPTPDPPADVQPLSSLHLQATGWGMTSPERRLKDLAEVARLIEQRFLADQEAYRASLGKWRQALKDRHPDLLAPVPEPGTTVSALPQAWRSFAESTVRSQLGERSDAFLASATVRQSGRGLWIIAGTNTGGLLIQSVGTP